jgi:alkylhydroperoxidase/carboxymuconolactone decarboxylase family protein YurZ
VNEELTEKQKQIKEKFIKARGFWNEEVFDPILRLDPDYLETYLNFSSVPWEKGVLPPKIKELIYIAIDASTTHLHSVGTRQHIKNAIKFGATKEEIMEVLELTSILGIHTMTLGVPILLEEIKAVGKEVG